MQWIKIYKSNVILKKLYTTVYLSYSFLKNDLQRDDEKLLLETLKEVAEYQIKDKEKLEKFKFAIELKRNITI